MGHRYMNRLVSRFDFKLIDNKRGLYIRNLFNYDSKFRDLFEYDSKFEVKHKNDQCFFFEIFICHIHPRNSSNSRKYNYYLLFIIYYYYYYYYYYIFLSFFKNKYFTH